MFFCRKLFLEGKVPLLSQGKDDFDQLQIDTRKIRPEKIRWRELPKESVSLQLYGRDIEVLISSV